MSTLEFGLTWSKRWHIILPGTASEPLCRNRYTYLHNREEASKYWHLREAWVSPKTPTCKLCWKRAERMGLEIPSVPGGAG